MKNNWSRVQLGELLKKSERWIRIQPNETYKLVTVRLWGKGVVLRGQLTGAEITASEMLQVQPDQFILSRIDARNGAFGLIPESLDGAIVSNDFPVFDIDSTRLLSAFLSWMSKTRDFVDFCRAASEGTTNRVRLKEDRFLTIAIALPPLEEQRRIVAKIDELAAKIEEAHRLRQMTLEEVMALVASRRAKLMNQARKFEEQVFDKAVEQIRGSSGLPLKEYQSTGRYPVIDQGQKFIAGYCDDERRLLHLPEAVVVWGDHTTNVKLIDFNFVPGADGTKVFVPKEGISAPFLFHFLKSVNFPDLGYSRHYRYLKQVLIPVPQSAEQRRIVAELDALQAKAEGLKQLQAQTAAEIDALLPSILDKAFKGEL